MSIDLNKIKKLYTDNLNKFGVNSMSVGWPQKNSQLLRFEKLLYVLNSRTENITVNDLGCGYGELFRYFGDKGFDLTKYYGYDISEEMIIAAKEYIKNQKAVLTVDHSITNLADYSISSGIFNVKFEEQEEKWIDYIFETLHNMNEFSIKGFSFNLLSTFVDYKEKHLFYGDPVFFWSYCREHFSKYVSLLHDYPLYEWTIIVKKDIHEMEET